MIIDGLSITEYHAAEFPSKSKLDELREFGTLHYAARYITKTIPGKDSSAFTVGNAFECYVFKPVTKFDEFDRKYAVKPEGMKFTNKDGQTWRDEHLTAGREILTAKEFECFPDMRKAILDNPIAKALLSQGRAQPTVRRELLGLGLTVQCRPDWLSLEKCEGYTEGAFNLNLKTSLSLDAFKRQVVDLGYHRGAALEQWCLAKEGIQAESLMLVVEKKLAPRCRVYRIPEVALQTGWQEIKEDLEQLADCYRRNDFSDNQAAISEVALPAWELRRMEEE